MKEKKPLPLPEFEIQANQFIHHVKGINMKLKRQKQGLINLILENSLSAFSDRYDALSGSNSQFFAMSQRLDQETVDHCLVSVQALGEVKNLKRFIIEVNKLAGRLGGIAYPNFMSMLQTTDSPSEIYNINDLEGRLPSFHKIFKFS
ncbi:hypothetical protein A2767_06870 [Candidatus Roizmanbacteria bacterium RIFCSPHIGHO2_01_FULL_35_10]|uniref:Uncharacterized protein n=1 Tax=Candidatus Roizmanbacteria bacterium RIFCSPLOWO2_01_FULL_35_13 TaxID=1802055 RepID=A0A1F7I7L5_9BACT|nr:MAG: hypothetical protein A2767_06870 [Candidatus Roizmanbacteria bacterium RIFCSPHIGHO2_01_FULL_35_10]OGK39354.1 MAG: hypothetical protein A3A74_05285 [Candidatus Roizmanbacteria bacterium RIFCSPLOWO2_01_FULL_35_13]